MVCLLIIPELVMIARKIIYNLHFHKSLKYFKNTYIYNDFLST